MGRISTAPRGSSVSESIASREAQLATRQLDSAVYQGAEKLLMHNRSKLVAGGKVRPQWIDGGVPAFGIGLRGPKAIVSFSSTRRGERGSRRSITRASPARSRLLRAPRWTLRRCGSGRSS